MPKKNIIEKEYDRLERRYGVVFLKVLGSLLTIFLALSMYGYLQNNSRVANAIFYPIMNLNFISAVIIFGLAFAFVVWLNKKFESWRPKD